MSSKENPQKADGPNEDPERRALEAQARRDHATASKIESEQRAAQKPFYKRLTFWMWAIGTAIPALVLLGSGFSFLYSNVEPFRTAVDDGFVCFFGSDDCRQNRIPCIDNAQCLNGQICADKLCVPKPEPECTSNSDCPQGEICRKEKCVTWAPDPECRKDSDCSDGKVCKGNKCQPKPIAFKCCVCMYSKQHESAPDLSKTYPFWTKGNKLHCITECDKRLKAMPDSEGRKEWVYDLDLGRAPEGSACDHLPKPTQ